MLTIESKLDGKKLDSMSFTERSSKEGRELTAKEMKEWQREQSAKHGQSVEFEFFFD